MLDPQSTEILYYIPFNPDFHWGSAPWIMGVPQNFPLDILRGMGYEGFVR